MGRASESSKSRTSSSPASDSFPRQHGVALQNLAPTTRASPAIESAVAASAAVTAPPPVSASVSVPGCPSPSPAPGIPVPQPQSRPHSRSSTTSTTSSLSLPPPLSSAVQHDRCPGLDEAVAQPAASAAMASSSSKAFSRATTRTAATAAATATATPPLLFADGRRSDSSPYGSTAMTPNRSQSPSGSGSGSGSESSSRGLRLARSTSRGGVSRRSFASRRSSRRSGSFDGAALVSGVEGRFGMPEALLSSVVLDDDMSEDGPLLDEASSSTEIPDQDFDENSPNEAVRASVSPIDDTTLSINTPRMWCLSVLFSILGSSTNLFFSLRYPSVAITPVIALLLVHPLGHLWDYLLKRSYDPEEEFTDGVRTAISSHSHDGHGQKKRLDSLRLWLAQGRWNEKEHTCVYVSSNVAFGFAFATDVIVEQTQFYNQEAPIAYQLLLTISTQILGYGFAGMARRFLVRPSGMVWPGTLMSAAMFSTLHKQENKPANGWTISRWKFFYIIWTCASIFYFLPGLLMPALSYFNVITWFAPKSVVLANLFGVSSGLGLFPMTFDWAQITYVGSPLLVPFWAAMNVIGGLAIVMWIIAPLFYYSNVLYSSYMPILSAAVFDNTGKVYDVSKILTADFLFDREAYSNYSRVFLPVTYMLSYGVQFAGLAALLTHTLCWHGQDIWHTWKKSLVEARGQGKEGYQQVSDSPDPSSATAAQPEGTPRVSMSGSHIEGLMSHEDIHSRLMKRYKDAPVSWYFATFVSMAAIGIFVVEYYPVHLPWYGLLLALAIGAIFFIPNGIIMAITNQHSSIYLICQLICGVAFPGRPIANMVFVTYGYISSAQGIKFASDLKLGHYMKIPPRIMFSVQIVATLVSSVTQIGVLNWMFANVRGICTPEAVNGFTCPIARVHFNGSILWGVVGPGEFFGARAIYRSLVWCFPLGALLPIPLWLYSRHKKHSLLRKVNLPVIFGAMGWIPPATGLNFSVWALVCFFFNYLVKRRANAWWGKYTMTLSAALDSGLAFGIVIVFFVFIYPGWMKGFSWWGTEVYKQGCDWQACSFRTVEDGEHFGPDSW
ncbi:hypothetical protein THARTR1_07342 [Trichoderma harzianum]|uniref:OPT family small oligopeptide transporter n=1 Tax=Trichoderma harzianum TaxID=5544 RepID=A0A2K0U2Z0_TRIHA|nr:hypothetical protein THARTR1_07342 [Trichoderma harzianum]